MPIGFKGSLKLKQEIESWVDENIITPTQAEILYNKYELEGKAPWFKQTGFILSAIALLLIGLGVILLISQNWNQLPVVVRTLTGLLPLITSYYFAFKFYKEDKPDRSELAFFFANLMFGMNIFLQAQIYHISGYYPDGIMWWIIGSIPAVFLYKSKINTILAQLLYVLWIINQMSYSQFSYISILFFLSIAYFVYNYRSKTTYFIFYAIVYLFVYNIEQHFNTSTKSEGIILFAGITLVNICLTDLFADTFEQAYTEKMKSFMFYMLFAILYIFTFNELLLSLLKLHLNIFSLIVICLSVPLFFFTKKDSLSIWSYGISIFMLFVFLIKDIFNMKPESMSLFFSALSN